MHFENLGQSRSLKQLKNCISFIFLGVRTRGGNSNQNLEKSRAVYLTPLSSPIPRSSRVLKTSDIHEFFGRIFREYFIKEKSFKNSVKKSVKKHVQKSVTKFSKKFS